MSNLTLGYRRTVEWVNSGTYPPFALIRIDFLTDTIFIRWDTIFDRHDRDRSRFRAQMNLAVAPERDFLENACIQVAHHFGARSIFLRSVIHATADDYHVGDFFNYGSPHITASFSESVWRPAEREDTAHIYIENFYAHHYPWMRMGRVTWGEGGRRTSPRFYRSRQSRRSRR